MKFKILLCVLILRLAVVMTKNRVMVEIQYDDKSTYEFSYTFDNEGYLKTCTVVYDNSDTTIYSFKWE